MPKLYVRVDKSFLTQERYEKYQKNFGKKEEGYLDEIEIDKDAIQECYFDEDDFTINIGVAVDEVAFSVDIPIGFVLDVLSDIKDKIKEIYEEFFEEQKEQ